MCDRLRRTGNFWLKQVIMARLYKMLINSSYYDIETQNCF